MESALTFMQKLIIVLFVTAIFMVGAIFIPLWWEHRLKKERKK